MSAVVDANLAAALVLPLPYSDPAQAKFAEWQQTGIPLLAPLLWEYEVATTLRRAVAASLVTTDIAVVRMRQVLALGVQCWPPTPELHEQALRWAERLGHSKTYDAHYLALAEQAQAEFWTADQRLANAARQAGATWVHWIGEAVTEQEVT